MWLYTTQIYNTNKVLIFGVCGVYGIFIELSPEKVHHRSQGDISAENKINFNEIAFCNLIQFCRLSGPGR